jgi:hypothetical protein
MNKPSKKITNFFTPNTTASGSLKSVKPPKTVKPPKNSSKTKPEVINTDVKVNGRYVYFTTGLKNPLASFFTKSIADGKKTRVLLKNITNEKVKSVLENVLKKHANVNTASSGKVLNPKTGRFVAVTQSEAPTFEDPISFEKTKFTDGLLLNKQWYAKKSLQKMIETGNTRVPHSRRELTTVEKRAIMGGSKYADKPMSSSVVLKMMTDFFNKYDGKEVVAKRTRSKQIDVVFAHRDTYVNRNETAHDEGFSSEIGDDVTKYPVYVSIEPEKNKIVVHFYLSHNDEDFFFTLTFKLNDAKKVEYVASSSFGNTTGKLQGVVDSFIKTALELSQTFVFSKKYIDATRRIQVFKSDTSPSDEKIKSEINSSVYKAGDTLTVEKLYDVIEDNMATEDWVSWSKVRGSGSIGDLFAPQRGVFNPYGRLRDSSVEVNITDKKSKILLVVSDEFQNTFDVIFSLNKNGTVKSAHVGPIQTDDDDMESDYYIHDLKSMFEFIAEFIAPGKVSVNKNSNTSNTANNNR